MSARVTERVRVLQINQPQLILCVCVCFLAKWHKQLEEM